MPIDLATPISFTNRRPGRGTCRLRVISRSNRSPHHRAGCTQSRFKGVLRVPSPLAPYPSAAPLHRVVEGRPRNLRSTDPARGRRSWQDEVSASYTIGRPVFMSGAQGTNEPVWCSAIELPRHGTEGGTRTHILLVISEVTVLFTTGRLTNRQNSLMTRRALARAGLLMIAVASKGQKRGGPPRRLPGRASRSG